MHWLAIMDAVMTAVFLAVLGFGGWVVRRFLANHLTKLERVVTVDEFDKQKLSIDDVLKRGEEKFDRIDKKLDNVVTLPSCIRQHEDVKVALGKGDERFGAMSEEIKQHGESIAGMKTQLDLLPKTIIAELKSNGGTIEFKEKKKAGDSGH